jgi:hypothetical protein
MKTPMLSEHFHPLVGMASDNLSGFYGRGNVIIDIDETHYTVAEVEVEAGFAGKPPRRFIGVSSVGRLPLSGPVVAINGWCPAITARGIVEWFTEKGFPLPRDFHDYLLGVENVEQLSKEDE